MAEQRIKKELGEWKDISIVNLIDSLVEYAHANHASDIHIDPSEKKVRVRLRIDGVLEELCVFPKDIHPEIISRIKILASLRTDEHQSPQDGRFRISLKSKFPIDVRVSIVPTFFGENAVLRLLSDKAESISLDMLGLNERDYQKLKKAVQKSSGMILATGPTGSGKTTTLYTILKMLNTKEVSIITIEDPIEYALEGIEQIQVDPRSSLTFANGLRSILRQDPNIIMVGEIRDTETAGIAVNTALTGHLLLSTLHTNDAATTLPRLLDMHIEPFLVASTVSVAIGQRLVRTLCPHCKVPKTLTEAEKKTLEDIFAGVPLPENPTFFEAKGCDECSTAGFRGRIGLYEVLVMSPAIREAILRKTSAAEIKTIALQEGMTPMVRDGLEKAARGLTTIEEVMRVGHE
ncbi:MAG: GspE/PulE family protein [Candidatus Pacebacteria bacterium]|nr:GspE/PulE family protein [Candidatus Paceibacterota bacterium]MDD5356692.1 GspE/PulE family protein [Candidatus Paceibacterota bacterium]